MSAPLLVIIPQHHRNFMQEKVLGCEEIAAYTSTEVFIRIEWRWMIYPDLNWKYFLFIPLDPAFRL